MQLHTLKKSTEFKRVRGGRRAGTDAFLIEAKPRVAEPADAVPLVRFGFTVTKKLGGAVVRNRVRRRLKAVVRSLDAAALAPGYDYVVIARSEAASQPFEALTADFRRVLEKIHRQAETVRENRPSSEAGPSGSARRRSRSTRPAEPQRARPTRELD